MAMLVRCSVEMEISNKTHSITLRKRRAYFDCGYCSVPPLPELSPGSSDTCLFLGRFFSGVAGILVYKAESFTLAIYFSNPIDYKKFPMELGLELSPGKAHLGSLEDTYTRMTKGTYSSSCADIKFDRGVVVGKSQKIFQLSHGLIRGTATMSDGTDSRLKVVLEEQGEWGEEARTENPCRNRHYQEK